MTKSTPFIVLTLPRSRSAWLAHWLSYPGKLVGHDIGVTTNSVSDFLRHFDFADGTVETGAMIGWRLLKHEIPNLKTLVVMRDPSEVVLSLAKKGLSSVEIVNEVFSRAHMLSAIGQGRGVKMIDWRELDNHSTRELIFEWLLEIPFDTLWDAKFASTNIQIDFAARMRQLVDRRDQIQAFKNETIAKQMKIGLSECPLFN